MEHISEALEFSDVLDLGVTLDWAGVWEEVIFHPDFHLEGPNAKPLFAKLYERALGS